MSDGIVTPRLLVIPEGKVVKIVDDVVKTNRPNYRMVGNGTMNKYDIKSIDLITEMTTLSRPSIITLARIQQGITWETSDGVVRIDMSDLTSAEQQTFKKGFKELHERDLVRRVKRSHYLINPNALIPIDYKTALSIWDSIS